MRKEAGFEVMNHIALYASGNERIAQILEKYGDEIERFCSMGNHLGNEDVFWAVVPEGFRYPSQEEALRFAFDTNPRYCYRLCGSRLPMGCHSWSKPRMWRFWQQIIPLPDAASGAAADK